MSSADENSFNSEDLNHSGALRISSITRDASGHVYNRVHKSVWSRNNSVSKTKLRFVERRKFEKNAMSRRQRQGCSILLKRFRPQCLAWCSKKNFGGKRKARSEHSETEDEEEENEVQFKVDKHMSLKSYLNEFYTADYHKKNYVRILHKMSYTAIFICSFVGFTMLVIVFALIIVVASQYSERCIVSSSLTLVENVTFEVAFAMSWVTLSTVGYGHLYPAPSERKSECFTLEFIAFFESFVGVFYAGLCGAIFYSRLIKALDKAEVSFSHAMCLRHDVDGFPALEIRIVNNLANYENGEIIDASVSCLVSKGWWSAKEKDDVQFKSLNHESIKNLQKQQSCFSVRASAPSHFSRRSLFASKKSKSTFKLMNETSNPEVIPVTQPNLPYFERIWIIRHRLDSDSPLLLSKIRRRLSDNGGMWPDDLRLNSEIRNCFVKFKEIIVTLNGTSSDTGGSVFAKSSYSLASIVEGWKFKEMIYEDEVEGRMKVDYELISDIIEENNYSIADSTEYGTDIYL